MTTLRKMLGLVESAVLAPVYRDVDGEIRLVLIVRGPRGIHGDQIALPGGKREDEGAGLRAAARRGAGGGGGRGPRAGGGRAGRPRGGTGAAGGRSAPY